VLLQALLALCALGAAFLVWRHDMYDREPWWALLATAALGGLLAPACGALETRAVFALTGTPSSALLALAAAGIEEGARLLAVLAVARLLPRVFNDPMDGITYGSMAGIGMSLYESAVRLGSAPSFACAAGALELARLGEHAVLGGIAGFPFGMWRTGMPGAGRAFLLCAGGATLLHFVVDAAGIRAAGDPSWSATATIVVEACVLLGFLLYGGLACVASEWSRRRFAPLSARRLLGWPFTLASRRDRPRR
jgi:RsiW-degrading membrane proteinase PrsW (M82 family)